jgi:hypothetical protein
LLSYPQAAVFKDSIILLSSRVQGQKLAYYQILTALNVRKSGTPMRNSGSFYEVSGEYYEEFGSYYEVSGGGKLWEAVDKAIRAPCPGQL